MHVHRHPPASAVPPLIQRLLDPAAYPHPTTDIHLIETHISWVILTGDYVYKLKKPCNLGFLDFSTLERRRGFCAEEVRLSGRFAPDLYLGVVPITGSADAPHVDGAGVPIEWALKLRQFDEAGRLDRLFDAGRFSGADCDRLGAEIAGVEQRLAVADPAAGWGGPDAFAAIVRMNLDQLVAARPDARGRAEAARAWIEREVDAARPVIEARLATGKIRECHGDLHLANIVLRDGAMMAFDGIEFNDALRWIDVANDIAFLAMDFHARRRPDHAARLLSSWMEAADDHAAARVLPLYMVYRAIVRAAVAAIRFQQATTDGNDADAAAARADCDRYLDLAEQLTVRPAPRLFITSGISGSGKTRLAEQVVAACGAIRIRSDVERKRLAGMAATDRPTDAAATQALYHPALTERVYERLATLADSLLAAGWSVVIDAACTRRAQREGLAGVARHRGVPLVWLEFDIPAELVLARVAARQSAGTDASDASVDVVRSQLASLEPITPEEVAATPDARLVTVTPWDADDPSFIATACRAPH